MKIKHAIIAITWILMPMIDGYIVGTKGPKILCFIFGSICGAEMYLEYKNLEED